MTTATVAVTAQQKPKKENAFTAFFKNKFTALKEFMHSSGSATKASMCFMGTGQLMLGQVVKGILYIFFELAAIAYFVLQGGKDIAGFFTLGLTEGNIWAGMEGDNSIDMMLLGIFAWFVVGFVVMIYIGQVKDVHNTEQRKEALLKVTTFKEDVKGLLNSKFYKTVLFLPIVGVLIFNVLPIIFMILIAFTTYGGETVPPRLVDWGFDAFGQILTLGSYSQTFLKILGWNFLWAFAATFANYFLGLGLALLLNKKCVKGKVIWRAFPVLAYAIPGFITLLAFKYMFANDGPINQMITANGGRIIDFFGIYSTWSARLIGFGVNAWISVPSIMLLATGLLSNMNADLYEAAEIDGASKWKQFTKITLPFIIFSTTPVLISQFIGNFNNFGIFYFLRGDIITNGYQNASDTDLLINWLYNMSLKDASNNHYNIAAVLSLIIFIITSVISLVVYVSSASYKKEDTYR